MIMVRAIFKAALSIAVAHYFSSNLKGTFKHYVHNINFIIMCACAHGLQYLLCVCHRRRNQGGSRGWSPPLFLAKFYAILTFIAKL